MTLRALVEWMIGLPAITFLDGEDGADGEARIHIETEASSAGCPRFGVDPRAKGRSRVELVDLPMFGRPVRLVWHKRRWVCADADCTNRSWTEEERRIAAPRQVLTARAARWATRQVGRCARSVNEVAGELGCDWHTVNGTVVAYGEALLEVDGDRIGEVSALALDEVLKVGVGPFHRQHFTTQLVRGLRMGLHERLHHRRRCREHRAAKGVAFEGNSPLGQFSPIATCPPIALERTEVGHLEGDLMTGTSNRSAIVTVFDRTSRHVWLADFPEDHARWRPWPRSAISSRASQSHDAALSPGIRAARRAATPSWPICAASTSTSAIPTLRGNVVPTRTTMDS